MNIALVQRRYHCIRQLRKFTNLHSRPYARCTKPVYLPGSNAQCVYCTEKAIPFLGSPYQQLPFDINIALVQRRYHCFRQRWTVPKFISRPYTRCVNPGYLPGRNAQWVSCTKKAITFSGSPYPQLPFDINIAWVQGRYHCFRQLFLGPIRSLWNRVICRAVTPSAFIAPRRRLHFWVLYTNNYLEI